MTVKNFCKDVAIVYRKTTQEDFSVDAVWAVVLRNVLCYVEPIPLEKRFIPGNGRAIIYDSAMYTDETGIREGDRIKVFYNKSNTDYAYFDVAYVDKPDHCEIALTKCPAGVSI